MLRTPGAAKEGANRFLLFPESEAAAAGQARESLVRPGPDAPLRPVFYPALKRWAGAFAMASINTRVVHRSAALWALRGARLGAGGHAAALPPLPAEAPGARGGLQPQRYSPPGEPFSYGERMAARSWLGALGVGLAMALIGVLSKLPGALGLLERLLPQPGQGPTPAARAAARFRYYISGTTAPTAQEPRGRAILAAVSGGDGGYTDTAMMLVEAGLLLAQHGRDASVLPAPGLGAGFLTPATAFGSALVDRLHTTGLRFDIVSDDEVPP